MLSVNPATGERIREYAATTPDDLEAALETAASTFERHRRTSITARSDGLLRLADILDADSERLSHLITEEMGKTIRESAAEIEKCARVCRYYADHAEVFLQDEAISTEARDSRVVHLPIGPVLAVMPWNFPFWQVLRFAAPALAAGNVVLLKHASNVTGSALALHDLVQNAFDEGVFQTLVIDAERVAGVLADPRVKAATVTGSTRAGQSVASIAGRHAKKTVLELGGSDAFIVMPSADLDQAIETGVHSRTLNNGQSCIGAKRFIVHADVYADFVAGFAARLEALVVGDPTSAGTDVGPLAMARAVDKLENQIDDRVAAGAAWRSAGHSIDGPGFYFGPGMLERVPRKADSFYEEIFGPVATMFCARDFGHAIELANDSIHGLGSSIWTHEKGEIDRAINELRAGATFVNALVKSDPRLPFGGIESSGYGRELARDGLLEFVNRKTVFVS